MIGIVPPVFFNPQQFDNVIAAVGPRVVWARAHTCPCTMQGFSGNYTTAGGAQPTCQTCYGIGTYWDNYSAPFKANISFGGFLPMPVEAGNKIDDKVGNLQNGIPLITFSQAQNATAWTDASQYDQVVEIDTLARYSSTLIVGVQEALPFFNGLVVKPVNAVTVWNPSTKVISYPSYTVQGSRVIVSGYTAQTPFAVDFYACYTYILQRHSGGMPHQRPFAGGTATFPRRFTADTLDLWLRSRTVQSVAPGWNDKLGPQQLNLSTSAEQSSL